MWKYGSIGHLLRTVQSEITKQIQDMDHIIYTNDSEFEQDILQLWRNYLLQNLSIATCIGSFVTVNEASDRSRQSSMSAMPVVDATRHLLYTALYHYQHAMYSDAINLLARGQDKATASSSDVPMETQYREVPSSRRRTQTVHSDDEGNCCLACSTED